MVDQPTNPLTNQEVVQQGTAELRRTVQHLPAFYRTDNNQRFLSSTMDALVQKGSLERLDGYVGRKDAYTRKSSDRYLTATSRDRSAYQLEPAVTYTNRDTTSVNPEDQVKFTGTYDDYINQIKYFGGKVNNHDRLNKEKIYSWNPAVDYDKLINYREYYWLPEGPNALEIDVVGPGAVVEYKVTNVVKGAYNFSIQDGTNNPILKLYRGNTYKFNIDAKGHPFYIMTEPYKDQLSADGSTSTLYTTGVTNNGTDSGIVTFTVPTSGPSTLYYQCGNHDNMNGVLQIEDIQTTSKIDPDKDIIGAKNYSLRTLDLSNGMKIKFTTAKVDTAWQNKQYYVEGVGDSITLTDASELIAPGSYSEEFTVGYDTFVYDSQPYAKALHRAEALDYITIKRDSRDRNSWSRYNRWFHRSVIEETARVGGYTPDLDESDRAKRPIIEFDSGLALYNHGTVAKDHITVIDTVTTDAFSDVVGKTGFNVDSISLEDGMRVIFTADTDSLVANNIYTVKFITATDSSQVISLTKAADGTPADGDSIFVEKGTNNQGKTFHYESATKSWKTSQAKTGLNQQPLFGMWDNDHVSFDDAIKYPNSTFTGAKVFEYATSDSATTDTVLGIKVKYKTINNVGDIVFDSDHTNGTFTYKNEKQTVSKNLAEGHLHYTTGRTTHNSRSAWIERLNESKQRVIRTYQADDVEKKLFAIDFYKDSVSLTDLEIAVRVNGVNKSQGIDYTLVDGTVNKYVQFTEELSVGDQVRIKGYSAADKVADKGIYEVPENIETNAENSQIGTFTLGQITKHVQDIQDKNTDVTGAIPGVSNLRDKPDARLKGGTIHQHQGSLLPAVFGLIDQQANVIRSIEYVNKAYEQWYNSFLTNALGTVYEGVARDRVDEIILSIVEGKNSKSPFYYEDMVGYGENVSTRSYTVKDDLETDYAIDSQHSMTALGNRAVYVYLNDVQLIQGTDYTFSTTDDSISMLTTLADGDKILIKDYADTTGSFIPPTPTKLGMYPKFKPELISDDTYKTTTNVIRKHDGSFIKAYGDERDDLILELEKRIYNNCKTAYDASLLDINDVVPSAFTSTEYTLNEADDVMSTDFFVWAGRNNVQYINNTAFTEGSPFTYNYSSSTDRITGEKLPGYWRAIYKYFYDTDAPHQRPWEMLGHSEKPSDWETTYGPAPYTAGNDVLWTAIATHTGRYAKPQIKSYLPVDASGNLLDPIAAGLIGNHDVPGRTQSWKFGDQAPAETAWRRSSAYPYTVIKTLALTKPAKFFSIFFDNSRLSTNTAGNYIDTDTGIRQTLAKGKYHLETETNATTGVTTRYATAGYQPLVVNYLISQNLDAKTFWYDKMKALTVQLAYKLGGFTDKDNIKILTDSVSPGSTSGSKFVPDENYKILFRTSNPVETFDYSGVLIEKNTDVSQDGSTLLGGYKVLGYSTTKPYFKFNYPIKSVRGNKVRVINSEVATYKNYQEAVQTIPYGYVFDTKQEVADFLSGYGHWLEDQGFRFNKYSKELKETLNWSNAIKEFLYWTEQNWAPGSAVTVSPAADGFELDTNNSIVGKLKSIAGDYSMLDAGGRKLSIREVSTKRIGKTFDISIKSLDVGLFNISLNTVQKEHIILFDNKTVFSDIIYDAYTGFRQERMKVVGWKTANWNGDYYAPGFVFDSAEVNYWSRNTDYKIGDTVEYQGKFYVAKANHTANDKFVSANWTLKTEKPQPQLIPNFDYKISQFNDFYNLETNNFDESQEQLAQRLIGYQNRDYLENLFVSDVSQYKFYQGYIREKGTKNAIDKILKAKYEGSDITLNLYPEWMIRTGRFGNVDARENIQIQLKENEILANPQSLEFYETSNFTKNYARSLAIAKPDFYYDPVDYNTATTFAKYDYSQAGYDRDSVMPFKTAGYVQPSQVQHTVFDVEELLDLDVQSFERNDLIWVANKQNLDWDVYRLTNTGKQIATLRAVNGSTQMEIEFSSSHNLNAQSNRTSADYLAIRNAEVEDLNRVFEVKRVLDHKTILVDFTGATGGLPNVEDESTIGSYGSLYIFRSVRFNSMNNVNDVISYDTYQDKDESRQIPGDKVFTDADASGLWRVYEKCDPYTVKRQLSPNSEVADQDFGWRIVARNDGRTLIASAPTKGQGEIHFMFRTSASPGTGYESQAAVTMTDGDDNTGRLGYSLSISTDENFVIAGAPFTNTVGLDGSSRYSDQGLIKIFVWNPSTFTYGILNTINPPTDQAGQNFGWSHAIAEPGASSRRDTPAKYLFVGAPGLDDGSSTSGGRVYMYEWGVGSDGSTYDTWTQNLTISSNEVGSGKRFGHAIAVNDNGDILAVSSTAPGKAGMVEIFRRTSQSNDDSVEHSFTHVQTLSGVASDGSSLNTQFGDSISMSKDGTTLVITAPGADKTDQADAGAVYYYKWDADGDSTLAYTLQQTINAPDTASNMRFGSTIDIDNTGTRLVIGAENFGNSRTMAFDSGATTFDLQDTEFSDFNTGSGAAYTATRYDTEFLIDDRLVTTSVTANDDFGRGVCVTDNTVFVGAPDDEGNIDISDGSSYIQNDGTVTVFDLTKSGEYAWKNIVTETPLMDVSKRGQVFDFDTRSNEIRDYYELYDPVKGHFPGVADREINYKTVWDPAVYNNGDGANFKTTWAEKHVGEVWWDLSRVKWLWYEQGTLEYKTNHWGKTFPGSEIHIYEWIESTSLPSEFIGGTPLHPDDTNYTIKQRYSTQLDAFVDYYYYWVRNTTVLPANSVVRRDSTTASVANLLSNPQGLGHKWYAPTDTQSMLIANVRNLANSHIVLNVDIRTNNFDATAHSVWKLARESDPAYRPGTQIEQRWWDSLVGKNIAGDLVPDIALPVNERYGNNIRPRQSWYVDRYDALKEVIDYANTVLKKKQLSGTISLDNLNKADPEPTAASLEWDATVDTYAELTYINTADLSGTVKYLVKADENADGFWSIHTWDGTEWTRTKLQGYNTGAYWSYVDWYGTDPEVHEMIHDENTPIDAQVTYEYELDSLDLAVGKHVKVTQADTGGWKLFMKTASGYTNVGTENGTIRLSTKLYDYTQDATGFAGGDTFDDNFFDQEPTIETRNVLTALRDDLFINELAVEYNNLFFIGLRKVLAEQTYVDWLFKTAFVNVTNTVRKLDQRKNYTSGTDSWVEEYINEVKPFHTKIREYKLGYEGTDTEDGIFTDFDNPPFYDTEQSKIRTLNVNSDSDKLTEYPYQMWYDYHKKYVSSITVSYGGTGYETAPTVAVIGGTEASTGPFQIQGTSNRGVTSGTYGYYYPLFTSEQRAKTWDTQNNSGSGTATEFSFDEYSGTFWMPDGTTNTGQSTRSTVYKLYDTPDTSAATATATVVNGSVTKITLTGQGRNYTTTPTVVLTGGKTDGTTPTDTARAYANLSNDLVRDFNTTIKFDRIQSTHSVVDWTANTAYAYGQLIRYNNELYKATDPFTSSTKFSDNKGKVYKVYGDETDLNAADRTAGMYAPTSAMPGNELSQLMSGIDYGGTMVTGLLFTQDQGWDRSGWYDYGWDHFGASNIVAFRGDGSTTTFTFDSAPASTKVYQVYTTINHVKTKTADSFRGDGSTTTFTLSSAPADGTLVEFIPFDDDGVLTPTDDRTLDTLLSGGLFNTALGTAASDVITDGDGFVTTETSYAPEEAVPGQIFDTLDIKVYTSPESGVPFITEKLYHGDATTTVYSTGEYPGTLASVTVSVDGSVKRLTTDFTVNVANKTVTFGSAPGLGAVISIRTFAISGENYRVLDQYTGDGSTVTFTTSTRGEFNLDSTSSDMYITIDGVPTTAFSTTITANTITVTFNSAPAASSFIQIAGFNKSTTNTRSFASIRNELIPFGGGATRYTMSFPPGQEPGSSIPLTFPPGSIGPFSGLTMIEVNGKMLRGPDITYYVGDGSTYTYGVAAGLGDDSTVDPAKTITAESQVNVFVNGSKKNLNTHYTVDIANNNVVFTAAHVPTAKDAIAIETLVNNHYRVEGTDFILNTSQIATDGYSLSNGDELNVTTFNNALGMKLTREVLEGRVTNIFKLRFNTLNSTYTFAWFNGEQLTPGIDFTVSGNTLTVIGKTITASDRLDVMYFAVDSAIGATGFRIFKDMLNRTFYKRINKNATTEIAEDVVEGSQTIQVKDGTVLPAPNAANNIPGVLFVDKERIEYFTKSGDTLGQLRRGTLGTGIKAHSSGTAVVDASGTQTIPYADTVYTNTFTGDGSTTVFALSQTPSNAGELDIFIGGQRLLLTSEDGSTINYSVDGSTTSVTFSTAPAADTQIKILHKRGQVWYTAADGNPANGKGLQASTTIQARFIAEQPTNAPE